MFRPPVQPRTQENYLVIGAGFSGAVLARELLMEYRRSAEKLRGVAFVGRLGTYRYLDMNAVIEESLNFSTAFVQSRQKGTPPPIFPNQEIPIS
jgi:UDP-galactopyranose mutase